MGAVPPVTVCRGQPSCAAAMYRTAFAQTAITTAPCPAQEVAFMATQLRSGELS